MEMPLNTADTRSASVVQPEAAPPPPPAMAQDALVAMGRILGPYGVKGWVKVDPWSESVATLTRFSRWWIGRPGAWSEQIVEEVAVHGRSIIARLSGSGDRDAAMAWRGAEVAVQRAALPPPEPGEYYWADLIGLQVINSAGESMGQVVEMSSNGAHDVMRVAESASGEVNERLIPFVDAVVREVALSERVIRVDWGRDW